MQAIIQSTPAWQLRASVQSVCNDQHHLMVTRCVPSDRRREEFVRWQAVSTPDELRALRDVIDKALAAAA